MELRNGGGHSQKRNNSGSTRKEKSIFWTYVLWIIGGFAGAHHVYLERDAQAFIYFSTLGGYLGLGWLRDIYRIPSYVRDVNEHPNFVSDFKRKVRTNRKVRIEKNDRRSRFLARDRTSVTFRRERIESCDIHVRNTNRPRRRNLILKQRVWSLGFSHPSRRCGSPRQMRLRTFGPSCFATRFQRTKYLELISGTC